MSLSGAITSWVTLALLSGTGCGPGDLPPAHGPQTPIVAGNGVPIAGTGQTPINNLPTAGAAGNRPVVPAGAVGWCDVQPILSTYCSQCHGAVPLYGAPMSLLTLADLQAAAKTDPGKKVYQRIGERIHDVQTPMPPATATPALTADARAKLDAWIGAGAPMGASATCAPISTGTAGTSGMGAAGSGGAPTVPPVGTGAVDAEGWPTDCGERYKFVASGAGGAKYAVPAGQPPYVNLSIPAPWGAGEKQALRFKPIIDNAKVIHHFILYAADGSFVNGWAPGDPGITMPAGVGLIMPSGTYRLEVHYNNQTGSAQMDGSGLEMCVAKTPRPNAAAVHWLGSLGIAVPAHGMQVLAATCKPTVAKGPVHLISVSPHMHRTGTHAKMVLNRAGGQPVVLHDAAFSFENQQKYSLPEDGSATDILVNAGDTITSTCTFTNDTNGVVTFGQNTENEMCFFFTIAWPVGQLVNGSRSPDGGSTHSCL
jgi:hypothetical protein